MPAADTAWFTDATFQPAFLLNTMVRDGEKEKDAVSKALQNFATEDPNGQSHIESIVSEMNKTNQDYPFVRLIAMTKQAMDVTKPLVDNVIRQGSFVDKMHSYLWLRSPAVEGTLSRAIDRYDKFTQLFRRFPGQMMVPTLDMDLAWHTHQLSHARYREDMRTVAGRFIDHDDKVGKGDLDVGEGDTGRLFEGEFEEEYMRCLCWDCEAIFSAVEADDEMPERAGGWIELLAANVRDDVQYHRAAEVARRKNWPHLERRTVPLPTREREA